MVELIFLFCSLAFASCHAYPTCAIVVLCVFSSVWLLSSVFRYSAIKKPMRIKIPALTLAWGLARACFDYDIFKFFFQKILDSRRRHGVHVLMCMCIHASCIHPGHTHMLYYRKKKNIPTTSRKSQNLIKSIN